MKNINKYQTKIFTTQNSYIVVQKYIFLQSLNVYLNIPLKAIAVIVCLHFLKTLYT